MVDAAHDRFGADADDELEGCLTQLERGNDPRLRGLIAQIQRELNRRRAQPPPERW